MNMFSFPEDNKEESKDSEVVDLFLNIINEDRKHKEEAAEADLICLVGDEDSPKDITFLFTVEYICGGNEIIVNSLN